MTSQSNVLLTLALYDDLSKYMDDDQLRLTQTGADLWPDATPREAQCHSLARSLLKKYNDEDKPSREACKAALKQFLFINARCQTWFRDDQVSWKMTELFHGLKKTIDNFWHRDGYPLIASLENLVDRGGIGPGSSRKAIGTDIYAKLFGGPLSYSREDLLYTWERRVSGSDTWFLALARAYHLNKPVRVEGNSMTFVNKNVTVARTICTEPTIEMWFQLGLGRHLEDRLSEYWNVNIGGDENQPLINRALAREGSISGRFATIDLTSASDTLSLNLLEQILPRRLFELCMLLRSKTTTVPRDHGGETVELNMMCNMGNGFCFPLQTIVFGAVIETVYRWMGKPFLTGKGGSSRNFGVFGDDMIVETDAAANVLELLRYIGCIPNESKTYVEGPFRESCGGDYFNGHHCRGVYIKRLKTIQDHYVAINALNRFTALTDVRLPKTVAFLSNAAKRKGKVSTVPAYEPEDSGVRLPLDMANVITHLDHGTLLYEKSVARVSSKKIDHIQNTVWEPVPFWGGDAEYRLPCDMRPRLRPRTVEQATIHGGEKDRAVGQNEYGLWIAFLRGDVRSGNHGFENTSQRVYRISGRQTDVRYDTKRATTFMWDSLGPDLLSFGLTWRQWSTAVYWNTIDV